jgi:hypothetical protein
VDAGERSATVLHLHHDRFGNLAAAFFIHTPERRGRAPSPPAWTEGAHLRTRIVTVFAAVAALSAIAVGPTAMAAAAAGSAGTTGSTSVAMTAGKTPK